MLLVNDYFVAGTVVVVVVAVVVLVVVVVDPTMLPDEGGKSVGTAAAAFGGSDEEASGWILFGRASVVVAGDGIAEDGATAVVAVAVLVGGVGVEVPETPSLLPLLTMVVVVMVPSLSVTADVSRGADGVVWGVAAVRAVEMGATTTRDGEGIVLELFRVDDDDDPPLLEALLRVRAAGSEE
jgi:hypothetical protein